jgi:archaellum component FlaC
MIFQIINIVVYGTNNEKRSIELRPNCVNIITGKSGTGKSAITHIVDYCLGRKKCYVPLKPNISRNVSWYAIKLQTSTGEIFIARKNPDIGKESSEDIYFVRGSDIALPEAEALVKNANLETLNTLLSQSLGIADYSHEPKTGQTRKTGNVDIRKALFYCFQGQTEIDDNNYLFHRQGDPYIPQGIKDYLPFFLGAITDDYIHGKENLRKLKRNLKMLEGRISENERLRGNNFEQAYALINEAKDVGLIPQSVALPATWQTIGSMLKEALSKNIESEVGDPDAALLNKLFDKQYVLRSRYRAASDELTLYINLKKNSGGYGAELKEQNARLESIGLFSTDVEGHTCPLCSSSLQDEIPAVSAIKESLALTQHQLEAVTNEIPHLDKLIQAAEEACDQIKIEIAEVKTSIISLQKTNERLSALRDPNARTAMVKGRLSLYLEHMPEGEVDFSSEIKKADTLKEQINKLEEELGDDALTERISSALSVVSSKITALAKKLGIEHSESPMRLDLKKLTVVADTEDGPIPMPKMGSGETWVGLHLVTHLALHNWFVKKSRPVPQFLFLDQPSQAYFPPDTSAETVKDKTDNGNPDRQSVIKMFRLVVSETQNFQVVITEHADIQEDWFQKLVREKWWDGKTKLIPVEWLEEE